MPFARDVTFGAFQVSLREMVFLGRRGVGGTVLGGLMAAWLSSACGSEDRPPPAGPCDGAPSERLPLVTSAYEQLGCNGFVEDRVTERGRVRVPAGPGSSDTIELAVARVFSKQANVKEDPIIYLDGGPGGASLENIEWLSPIISKMAPDRDIIFLDQRGVGQSTPSLQCTDSGDDIFEAIDACHARLSETVDLSDYNTVNNARDVDLVRKAFGYEKWNLLGISYGTRLGLTVMRDFPEGVRSVLIDSVVPLQRDVLAEIGVNGYAAILGAFDACAQDSYCSEQYPDPLGQLTTVVERLNAEPFDAGEWELEGDYFLRFVFELLYSPSSISVVPYMIDLADQGDFDFFLEVEEGGTSGSGLSFGMHLSLHCAEEVPFSSRADYIALDAAIPEIFRASLSGVEYHDWCQSWPVDKAPAAENEPVVSDLPTLVMAGEFDPITPPSFAEAAHQFLENGQYVLVKNESHGASFSECGSRLAQEFFDDPAAPLSSSCLEEVPQIDWLSGGPRPRTTRPSSGKIKFHTQPPTAEEIEKLISDLKQRRSIAPPRIRSGR